MLEAILKMIDYVMAVLIGLGILFIFMIIFSIISFILAKVYWFFIIILILFMSYYIGKNILESKK